MREDAWLAARLGCPCYTVEEDDQPPSLASDGFWQAKVDCADTARVAALEDAGMRVVDVNITLRREAGTIAAPAGVEVGASSADERSAVIALARDDLDVSRFHLDPLIADERARSVKADWAAAVLDGERGEGMLVARRAGRVGGFLAVVRGTDGPVIDLIAVASSDRRAGIGAALVAALVERSGAEPIDVGTQVANTGALRFYERLGFVARGSLYVLHGHAR
jgi:ribosomal protein S18 acetylase RimI-like enzyme